jgi:hypothetical protein
MADLLRDFCIRETGTGQQVAQLHDRYMMMMMINEFKIKEGEMGRVCGKCGRE